MSCGCGMPNERHGDERNITRDDLEHAAHAAGCSTEQAAENIMSCCQTMGGDTSLNQQRDQAQSQS